MSRATLLALPTRGRGRPSAAAEALHHDDLRAWCDGLLQIKARLDFTPGLRGWCYLLEQEHGLPKGDFGKAERLITECRKSGLLPLNFCAVDGSREWQGFETIDGPVEDEADAWLDTITTAHERYTPVSFWDAQDVYIMLLVEKVDLKALWADMCRHWRIPIANAKGWADINQRAEMMRRFKNADEQGRQPVLLVAGDFDPAGLLITDSLRENLGELSAAVGWRPDRLIVDRFGLTREFIDAHQLPWIDGLETGSGESLADKDHRQHNHRHVQDYIREHGERKVEANALVVRADAGRRLLHDTIRKYLPENAVLDYQASLRSVREQLRLAISQRLAGWS